MNALQQTALAGWYYGSLPYRWLNSAIAAGNNAAPVMVLFYHRVADRQQNDWTIPTRTFIRHIKWLRDRFDMVSLEEAQNRIHAGNSRPAVCVTFDDGYADNCDVALPWLIEQQIPVTYFVTSGNVLSGEPFPHDRSAGIDLPPNTVEQIESLAEQGVEIGAHTRTHADLGMIADETALRYEVMGSVADLEEITGKPVRYFAFPFGLHANLNGRAFAIAREAGLRGVVSAYGGYNYPGDDAFHLQRIHGDPEFLRLKNWVTVDPRKRIEKYSETTTNSNRVATVPV